MTADERDGPGQSPSSELFRLAVAYNDALDRCTQTGGENIEEVMAFFADDAVRIVTGRGDGSRVTAEVGKAAIRELPPTVRPAAAAGRADRHRAERRLRDLPARAPGQSVRERSARPQPARAAGQGGRDQAGRRPGRPRGAHPPAPAAPSPAPPRVRATRGSGMRRARRPGCGTPEARQPGQDEDDEMFGEAAQQPDR